MASNNYWFENNEYKKEKREIVLAGFDTSTIGRDGYQLKNKTISLKEENVVFFDWDDTAVPTTQFIKGINSKIIDIFRNNFPDVKGSDIFKILEAADKFSKQKQNIYKMERKVKFLCFVIKCLSDGSKKTANKIIELANAESLKIDDNALFYNEIKSILEKIYDAPVFNEILYFIKNKPASIKLGIFTFGDPVFQLNKITKFLKQNPEIKIDYIWLTKILKSSFIKCILKGNYISDKQWIIIDDSPPELLELDFLAGNIENGVKMVPIRSVRPNTKNENKKIGKDIRTFNFGNDSLKDTGFIKAISNIFAFQKKPTYVN